MNKLLRPKTKLASAEPNPASPFRTLFRRQVEGAASAGAAAEVRNSGLARTYDPLSRVALDVSTWLYVLSPTPCRKLLTALDFQSPL